MSDWTALGGARTCLLSQVSDAPSSYRFSLSAADHRGRTKRRVSDLLARPLITAVTAAHAWPQPDSDAREATGGLHRDRASEARAFGDTGVEATSGSRQRSPRTGDPDRAA